MPRIALGVEYDGSGFSGFQSQKNGRTVQDDLEEALARVANEPIAVTCAGRTDAGVHALGQVVHFDTAAHRPLYGWMLGTNTYLSHEISIQWAREVPDTFHARYSANGRSYRYFILNRRAKPAIWHRRVICYPIPLRADLMHLAGQSLLGEHDFSSFRAKECQAKHPVRTLEAIAVERRGDLVVVAVRANAFLHHMVRNIVGTLLPIGTGEQPPSWMNEVLAAKDRKAAGITAPPDGLYLSHVRYPDCFDLPAKKGDCLLEDVTTLLV